MPTSKEPSVPSSREVSKPKATTSATKAPEKEPETEPEPELTPLGPEKFYAQNHRATNWEDDFAAEQAAEKETKA